MRLGGRRKMELAEVFEARKKKRENRIQKLLAKGEYMTYTDAFELYELEVHKRDILAAAGVPKKNWTYVSFDTPEKFYQGIVMQKLSEEKRINPNEIRSPKYDLTYGDFMIAEKNGISAATLYTRMKLGWDKGKAITEKTQKTGRNIKK